MSNISQRDAFWNRIYELACIDRDIIIVSADMGAPALDRIRKDLPSQFVNVGIAEQNAITLAAGLALSGKKVYTYAIAPFITLRCLEQTRVESAIMNIPINIVGVGAGFSYEDSGPTHHLIEDIAIMRSMPNITIHSVTDSVMAKDVAERTTRLACSNYVRLDRQVTPDIYSDNVSFDEGVAVLRVPQAGPCIISTGTMIHHATLIAETLAAEGVEVGLLDLYRFPINESALLKAIGSASSIITIEEHFLPGGLGSAVCETLIDHSKLIPVKRLGLHHDKAYCYQYGGRETIRSYYGADLEALISQVRSFLK